MNGAAKQPGHVMMEEDTFLYVMFVSKHVKAKYVCWKESYLMIYENYVIIVKMKIM